jgi:hypothetical protein
MSCCLKHHQHAAIRSPEIQARLDYTLREAPLSPFSVPRAQPAACFRAQGFKQQEQLWAKPRDQRGTMQPGAWCRWRMQRLSDFDVHVFEWCLEMC